jgi:hypothetical protein
MSRRQQTCKRHDCDKPRERYGSYGFCHDHEVEMEIQEQAEREASPKYQALQALEECKTGTDLKDFIREHLIETLL